MLADVSHSAFVILFIFSKFFGRRNAIASTAESSEPLCKILWQQQNRKKIMVNRALSTFPILTTERLTLRQLLESDVQEIFLLRSDTTINKFLDRKPSETLEDTLDFIRNIKNNELLYWAIAQTYNGKLIGTICLFDFSDELNKCEIGYELLTDYQGQGIMSEAAIKIIEFAVDTLGIKTIDAFTHKDNHSSTKFLQKFNFEKTGIIDEANPNLERVDIYRDRLTKAVAKQHSAR